MSADQWLEDEWDDFHDSLIRHPTNETVDSAARLAFVMGFHAAFLCLAEHTDAVASDCLRAVIPAFEREYELWADRVTFSSRRKAEK